MSEMSNIGELENTIIALLVNELHVSSAEIDVNIQRDTNEILELFYMKKELDSVLYRFPEIAQEWDEERNGRLTPDKITSGSDLKVWWKCKKGHNYKANIGSRTRQKSGCPYCSGRMAIPGKNDLATLRPDLVSEWNIEKNGIVTPSTLTCFSNKRVWWKCSKGHEWKTSPSCRCRDNGSNCPYCSGNMVISGENDLATLYPNLLEEWNFDKNGKLTPHKVAAQSNKRVWWKCLKGHEWQAPISRRTTQGSRCPFCYGHKVIKGENDLATTHPLIIEEWNYEKNGSTLPTDVMAGSSRKVWWKCSKGHEWQAFIYNRTGRGDSCPICSGHIVRPILCVETGIVYLSAELAAKAINQKHGSHIISCCKGIRKTAGGYHWQYGDEKNT